MRYRYNSLDDFLASHPLTVDGQGTDGAEIDFPVKGREIEATILFADITEFSRRTRDLSPTETLIFVNHFFTWISAEGLMNRPGIIDKYIGDEVMVVFSKEFGSIDPFADAIQTACGMIGQDILAFKPHVGISSGLVIVGYVGTPIKYNCSVFGAPVTLAARCASAGGDQLNFPASEWGNREIDDVVPRRKNLNIDGEVIDSEQMFTLVPPRTIPVKNLPNLEVRSLRSRSQWSPCGFTVESSARDTLRRIKKSGRYWA